MKNNVIAAIVSLLVIALGIQAYMLYRLNDRINQLTEQNNLAGNPPKLMPKSGSDGDDFFKDQPWNAYDEIQRMQNEMEHIFGDAFSRFHLNSPLGSLSKIPDVDLQEKPDRYVVTVNAPGADVASLNVKLDDQRLEIAIKTEHAKNEADKNGPFRYRERFIGEFHRVLTLPGPANASKMTTDYRNGVLTVTIPKI